MSAINRRDFLAATSFGVARTLAAPHRLATQRLPAAIGDSLLSANAWFPDPTPSANLRALASHAVDTARSAGASYADVRVAERHDLFVSLVSGAVQADVALYSNFSYGIRVLVNGAWAFLHGNTPSSDAVAAAARDAVTVARGYAPLITQRAEFTPTPTVTGEWATPVQIDPFTVSIRDQSAVLGAYIQATARVHTGGPGESRFHWTRETRVVASTEGTLVTQRFRRFDPRVFALSNNTIQLGVLLPFPQLTALSGGFETVANPQVQDDIKAWTERVTQMAALPVRTMDVGRYPVVFDGSSLGMVLSRTVGAALELDRVLGDEADASGTSLLSPPEDMLGTPISSSLLTVTGHRAMPSVTAAKWDDEGVETQAYPVITAGRLVDYHTSRPTAPTLRDWYARTGQPLRSRGCVVASRADEPVMIRQPHLTVTPNRATARLDDLCKEITRGVLVCVVSDFAGDHRLASGNLTTSSWGFPNGLLLGIEHGQLVSRLDNNGIQFATTPFWKSQLIGLGDASTVCPAAFTIDKGMPWRAAIQSTTAPAGLFKDVNVISTKIRV